MKTMQELYNEVMADKELKVQFLAAANAGRLEAFLKEHGCEATVEEVKNFLEAKANEDAPLSFDELENAAGGECNSTTALEAAASVCTAGLICATIAIASAASSGVYNGQKQSGDGRLCNGID